MILREKVCLSSPRHASKAKSLVVLSSHAGVFLHTTTTSRDPYGKKRRVAALPLYNKIYKPIGIPPNSVSRLGYGIFARDGVGPVPLFNRPQNVGATRSHP